MTGRTISHFEVLEKLGEGGMGVVYKARDVNLGRLVALKVLPPDRMSDTSRRKRFIQEAKAASALNFPISLRYMKSLNLKVAIVSAWSWWMAKRWTN